MRKRVTKRFAAKLLFQYRVVVERQSSNRRICEERTIVFEARSKRAALSSARRRGQAGEYAYLNGEGNKVHFEFVGVTDLLCLDCASGQEEVWYEIRTMLKPMERKAAIIPTDAQLLDTKQPN